MQRLGPLCCSIVVIVEYSYLRHQNRIIKPSFEISHSLTAKMVINTILRSSSSLKAKVLSSSSFTFSFLFICCSCCCYIVFFNRFVLYKNLSVSFCLMYCMFHSLFKFWALSYFLKGLFLLTREVGVSCFFGFLYCMIICWISIVT